MGFAHIRDFWYSLGSLEHVPCGEEGTAASMCGYTLQSLVLIFNVTPLKANTKTNRI